ELAAEGERLLDGRVSMAMMSVRPALAFYAYFAAAMFPESDLLTATNAASRRAVVDSADGPLVKVLLNTTERQLSQLLETMGTFGDLLSGGSGDFERVEPNVIRAHSNGSMALALTYFTAGMIEALFELHDTELTTTYLVREPGNTVLELRW